MMSASDGARGEDCLSDELFAAYLENLLNDNEKEKIELHLSQCKTCRQQSIVFNKVRSGIMEEALLKAPRVLTERAKQLVNQPQAKDWIEVVLKFAKDSIMILKDTASVIKPLEVLPIAVRQGMTAEAKNAVFLSKIFNDVEVDIIIEHIDNESCEIEVRTIEASTGNPLEDIRLNLICEGKELASYLTEKGRAYFKNLDFDIYTLIIIKGQVIIGEILLRLESAQ